MFPEKIRKKTVINDEIPLPDKAAGKIAATLISIQRKFVSVMSKWVDGIGTRRLRNYVALFCFCCGGYSIYLILGGVTDAYQVQTPISISNMAVPKHIKHSGDELLPESVVDEATVSKIQVFKMQMDSLKQHNIYQYDSILQARPGLMDSLQMLEALYYSQQKNDKVWNR